MFEPGSTHVADSRTRRGRHQGASTRKRSCAHAALRASKILLAFALASYLLCPGAVRTAFGEDASAGGGAAGTEASSYDVGFYLFFENTADPANPISVDETQPRIIDAAGSLQLYAQAEIAATGDIDWADSLGVGTAWSIEETYDEDGNVTTTQLAEIDRGDGKLRALGQGNGSVKVRCTAMSPYSGYGETIVQIQGNSGVPYVTGIQICDENGAIIADDAETRLDSEAFGLEKHFYAQVTYVDPITGETSVKDTFAGDAVAGITWTVSGDSGVCYVNPDTGVVVPQKTGTVTLRCSIAGAGQLGDTIEDKVTLLLGGDELQPDRDYQPVDYIKVVVKYAAEDKSNYASREDYDEARTWYYTIADLEALGTTTNHYTLVKRDGSWDRMDAYGIYLQQLIDDQNLENDDIDGFYFHANDAANSGYLSLEWVFNADRYYFPNMGMGTGLLDARQVAPMLATKTVQITSGSGLEDIDVSTLSDQTRVRLCLGAESPTTNNAQKSLYNIDEITIILSGAPPAHWEKPENGSSTVPGSGGNDKPDGDDKPSGDDDKPSGDDDKPSGDDDKPNGDDKNDDGGDKADDNRSDGDPTDNTDTNRGSGPDATTPTASTNAESNNRESSSSESKQSEQQSQQTQQTTQQSTNSDADTSSSNDSAAQEKKSWQIYEMMRADDPNVDALDVENPYVPWAIGLLLGTSLAAVGVTVFNYRRQLVVTASDGPSAPTSA